MGPLDGAGSTTVSTAAQPNPVAVTGSARHALTMVASASSATAALLA